MDRFTWGVAIGVLGICLAALGAVLLGRAREAPPDLSRPDGVVTAYILAIQRKDPDRAWEFLASADAASPGGRFRPPPFPSGPTPFPTPSAPGTAAYENEQREQFRRDVLNAPRQENKRLRILQGSTTAGVAKVDVEVSYVASGFPPFSYTPPPRVLTFELRPRESSWRITSAPIVWELA